MAHRPSLLALLFALFTLFTTIHAQAVAPAAPAEPVAPVAPVNPAPAAEPVAPVANPAPAPADPVANPKGPAVAAPAPANPGVGGVGVGGGAGVPTLAATQYPTVMNVPKIVTVTEAGGIVRVTSTDVVFTQTFVSTALEEWKFKSVRTGVVGLGSLASLTNAAPAETRK